MTIIPNKLKEIFIDKKIQFFKQWKFLSVILY